MIEKESNEWIPDLLNYSLCLQLTRRVHEWEEGIPALVPFPPPSHCRHRNTEKVERLRTLLCDTGPGLHILFSSVDYVYVQSVERDISWQYAVKYNFDLFEMNCLYE